MRRLYWSAAVGAVLFGTTTYAADFGRFGRNTNEGPALTAPTIDYGGTQSYTSAPAAATPTPAPSLAPPPMFATPNMNVPAPQASAVPSAVVPSAPACGCGTSTGGNYAGGGYAGGANSGGGFMGYSWANGCCQSSGCCAGIWDSYASQKRSWCENGGCHFGCHHGCGSKTGSGFGCGTGGCGMGGCGSGGYVTGGYAPGGCSTGGCGKTGGCFSGCGKSGGCASHGCGNGMGFGTSGSYGWPGWGMGFTCKHKHANTGTTSCDGEVAAPASGGCCLSHLFGGGHGKHCCLKRGKGAQDCGSGDFLSGGSSSCCESGSTMTAPSGGSPLNVGGPPTYTDESSNINTQYAPSPEPAPAPENYNPAVREVAPPAAMPSKEIKVPVEPKGKTASAPTKPRAFINWSSFNSGF